ncbi:MAG: hypothetical protein A2X35_03940 [Elusimicrobia bacterium GWA2_61_42]|nr:MAG: hypothetical protein A2X35_03940 [Elusimicrobia bacterium GWA2_61_42]OGR76737.1 MAG: hypothetical protein A2X38_12845 [Elusimicrobia bacterium GWC2_61_25]
MKNSGIQGQDNEAFGKLLQAMLLTAFSPDNFDPFLRKLAEILCGPGGLGAGTKLAIIIKGRNGAAQKRVFNKFTRAEQALLLADKKSAAWGKGRFLQSDIRLGNAKAGRIAALLGKPAAAGRPVHGMLDMAAKVAGARLAGEARDAELNYAKDIAAAVKHVEELYLAFPGISIEEISRAVLDEARRLTGSTFGFAGYIDPATGCMLVPSLTTETWDQCRMKEKPAAFGKFNGLWGWVIKRKKPLLTNRAAADSRAAGLPPGHITIDKFLGVPALSGRKLLGMLGLANPRADYGPADLSAAQKLARVYAIILQRKLAEDKQREEDSRFKAIISSSKDIIYTADLSARITYISPRVEDYGYKAEELIGRSIVEFAHPDDQDFIVKAFANAVKTGRTLPILPYRVSRRDGTYFYAEQKSGVVTKNGRPLYITGVMRDVTEQKNTEIRLKESEAMMRMVFDTAKDAIFIKDMNGMYVKVNKACADMMAATPEAMIGRTDSDYFPPEIYAEVFRTDSEVVRSGQTLSLNNHHPFPGGSRYVNIIKTPLKGVGGQTIGLLGIARDITDLKKMETELALARAADAVSKVARPMAHDFNNALAAINGYATLIADDLPASSPISNEISRIIEAVKRAAELTSKFQDFARNPKIDEQGGGDA